MSGDCEEARLARGEKERENSRKRRERVRKFIDPRSWANGAKRRCARREFLLAAKCTVVWSPLLSFTISHFLNSEVNSFTKTMHYHPAILVFACLGALVLALAVTERELFGGDDCCKGDKWQAHTAEYKHSVLQEKILSNLKQAGWPGVLLGSIFVESMDPSFDMIRDDLPWDRSKLIHT